MQQIPTGFIFLISFVMGALAYYLAKKRGKRPYLWFWCGFFFGLLGVLFLYFLPSKQKAQEAPAKALPDPFANKTWYYLDQDMKQLGPMSASALKEAWEDGLITTTTYLWNPELDDWKPLEDFLPKTTNSL